MSMRAGSTRPLVRLFLVILGLAAMAAARSLTFIGLERDVTEPAVPPLLWLFHGADTLFLPGANRLHGHTPVFDLQCAALTLSLVCFYLAARATVPRLPAAPARALLALSLGLGLLLTILDVQGTLPYRLTIGGTRHYANDAVVATNCAARAFLRGADPYRTFRVIPCLRGSMDQAFAAIKTTPLQAGAFAHVRLYPSTPQLVDRFRLDEARREAYPAEFESSFSYPAASFLIPAAVIWAGLGDLSIFFTLCYVAIGVLALWRARGAARAYVALALLANAALWPTVSSGATDSLYVLPVALAWIWRERCWPSALLMALAIATRQQAWFYALFYLVLIWRVHGRRDVLGRAAIMLAVFAVANVPFILAGPGEWLRGVVGPLRDPMFPLGNGIIALSIGDRYTLPLLQRPAYSLLEALALAATLLWYWRNCRVHPNTGLVLATVPLFFAWRSLFTYFVPLTLLVLYPAFVDGAGGSVTACRDATTPLLGAPEGGEEVVRQGRVEIVGNVYLPLEQSGLPG